MIKTGSHSRLVVFEQCPKHAELKFVDKIPENPRPLPPGKTEHANDRGTRVHDSAEQFVDGRSDRQVAEMLNFKDEFERLRAMHKDGMAICEHGWGFDEAWSPVSFHDENVWIRIKTDATAFLNPAQAVIIDYKTGKRRGNEIKHGEQIQIYQLGAFLKYPKLEELWTELWYLDLNELVQQRFTRDQGLRFLKNYNQRFLTMTTTEEFEPRGSIHNCRFCPYRTGKNKWVDGTGHCDQNPE